ncbi:MAG: hypothetical protein RXQ96_08360 [Thermocladium sp.]
MNVSALPLASLISFSAATVEVFAIIAAALLADVVGEEVGINGW